MPVSRFDFVASSTNPDFKVARQSLVNGAAMGKPCAVKPMRLYL